MVIEARPVGLRAQPRLWFLLPGGAWRLWRLPAQRHFVAKTDPPLVSVMAALIARLKGARLVNWLQDIFPEVAEALKVGGGLGSAAFRLMRPLRNWSLHSAHANVVVGAKMAEHLKVEGIASEKIRIIPNWADGALIVPIAAARMNFARAGHSTTASSSAMPAISVAPTTLAPSSRR
jgi:hypothetical protein